MSDDKVVGLDGKVVTFVGNTEPVVIELLETMLEAARKGVYKSCAIVLQGEDHLHVTAYHAAGSYTPIEGMAYIAYRIHKGLDE